jgi:hypothetical protein
MLDDDDPAAAAARAEYLLVLLRSSAPDLTEETLETAANSAWADRFGPNLDGAQYVQSGDGNIGFVVSAYGNALLVLTSERGVRRIPEPAVCHPVSAREILSTFSHDISVGLMYDYDTDSTKLWALVGSLTVALSDRSTIGLYHLSSRQLWHVDQDVLDRLEADPAELVHP